MGNTRRNTQTAQAEPEVEAPAAAAAEAQAEETPEQELARLRAEVEELRKRKERKPREKRMTPKQRKLVEFLREHPEASIAEACEAAGATATSHGLVFRMIEDGYLRVEPAAPTEEPGEDQPEGEDAPTEE